MTASVERTKGQPAGLGEFPGARQGDPGSQLQAPAESPEGRLAQVWGPQVSPGFSVASQPDQEPWWLEP